MDRSARTALSLWTGGLMAMVGFALLFGTSCYCREVHHKSLPDGGHHAANTTAAAGSIVAPKTAVPAAPPLPEGDRIKPDSAPAKHDLPTLRQPHQKVTLEAKDVLLMSGGTVLGGVLSFLIGLLFYHVQTKDTRKLDRQMKLAIQLVAASIQHDVMAEFEQTHEVPEWYAHVLWLQNDKQCADCGKRIDLVDARITFRNPIPFEGHDLDSLTVCCPECKDKKNETS